MQAANAAVKTRIVVADFRSSGEQQFWDDLARQLCDLDVSVLVNNVGINRTERFDTIDPTFLRDIVSVNCTSQLLMTRLLINSMLNRPLKSAVISISSVAGLRPLLYLSPYSATKAFNDFFSRSLQLEVGDKIDVLSLRAGYVVSNMSQLKETGGFVLDRFQCARGCIEKLGFVSETYGHVAHAVYGRSFIALPDYTIMQQRKRRLLEKQGGSALPATIGGPTLLDRSAR